MIKVGQIWKVGEEIMCVTMVQLNGAYNYILPNGYCGLGIGWITGDLVISYPTWQEAVNSPEFKGKNG